MRINTVGLLVLVGALAVSVRPEGATIDNKLGDVAKRRLADIRKTAIDFLAMSPEFRTTEDYTSKGQDLKIQVDQFLDLLKAVQQPAGAPAVGTATPAVPDLNKPITQGADLNKPLSPVMPEAMPNTPMSVATVPPVSLSPAPSAPAPSMPLPPAPALSSGPAAQGAPALPGLPPLPGGAPALPGLPPLPVAPMLPGAPK